MFEKNPQKFPVEKSIAGLTQNIQNTINVHLVFYMMPQPTNV